MINFRTYTINWFKFLNHLTALLGINIYIYISNYRYYKLPRIASHLLTMENRGFDERTHVMQ